MEEIIAWFITGILVFVVGCVCGRSTNRRAVTGTGSDLDRARDRLGGTADDNQRLREAERVTEERLGEQAEVIRRAGDNNQRAQNLVRRARDILNEAQHTDSGN